MEIWQAVVLSIVEGISEFLPISSTGHLVLTTELLGIPHTEFVKSFEIIIQLGAILAVVALYWRRLIAGIDVWKNIIAAFIPTAIIGLTLYKIIKDVLIGNSYITVAALLLGGIILIALELFFQKDSEKSKVKKENIEDLSIKKSFLIGLIQGFSIIPGVSRSAASIMGGLFLGLKRQTAVEFSFLLAIPTMMAATGLDLIKTSFRFSQPEWIALAVGFAGSFIVALFVVKWFLKYVQNNNFIAFGVYRIIAAIAYYLIILR